MIVTPAAARLSFDRTRDLQEHLDYAVDLGAQVVQHPAADVVSGLGDLVHSLRITHVVLGREPKRGLAQRLAPDVIDRLLQMAPGLDVHLVGTGPGGALD